MRVEGPKGDSRYCTCCKAIRSLLDFKWNTRNQRYNTTCLKCAHRKKLKSIMIEEQKKEMMSAKAQQNFDEFIELLSK